MVSAEVIVFNYLDLLISIKCPIVYGKLGKYVKLLPFFDKDFIAKQF